MVSHTGRLLGQQCWWSSQQVASGRGQQAQVKQKPKKSLMQQQVEPAADEEGSQHRDGRYEAQIRHELYSPSSSGRQSRQPAGKRGQHRKKRQPSPDKSWYAEQVPNQQQPERGSCTALTIGALGLASLVAVHRRWRGWRPRRAGRGFWAGGWVGPCLDRIGGLQTISDMS